MSVPIRQQIDIALYILKQKIMGRKRYPLVLMLEPLFRCNLSCVGCGKIDYPPEILNQRLTVEDCLKAVEECGAPVVSIPGGEPLIHRDMPILVKELVRRKKYVYLCTNALLMEKKLHQYQPSPYLTWSVHLDGLREDHDRAVNKPGVYDIAERAIKQAIARGFRVNINCTLFNTASPERTADFFDHMMEIGVNAMMISPGYAYERAVAQDHFLNRRNTKELFRAIFRLGKERRKQGKPKWRFSQSALFLDFLAGNQTYECTPWGTPCYNIFGWQRPCYLIGEGYVKTFKELMEQTDWEKYGAGRYEKCADCMVHCGYEPTAAEDAVRHPLKLIKAALKGPRTEGEFAPDPDFSKQRPAEYVFSNHVQQALEAIKAGKAHTFTDRGNNNSAVTESGCYCACTCGEKKS